MSDVHSLQRVEELPTDYRADLDAGNVLAAWTLLRAVMPVGKPNQQALATKWSYKHLRPLMLRAGSLVPMERAERRVLAYVNPGLPRERMATTPSIFFGLQMIMPGERAPNHKHIPAAARVIIEGSGAYTTVDDEKLHMEPGDVILTPPLHWHDHGNEGKKPVIWMDVLDHPLAVPMDVSYILPGALAESYIEQPDSGDTWFSCPGLVPYRGPNRRPPDYPLRRFRWDRVRGALMASAEVASRDEPVHLRYCNPETGKSILKTMDFSARLVRPGESRSMVRASANRVFLVMGGRLEIEVNGATHVCEQHDTVCVPTYASVTLQNTSSAPAFLLQVDDTPTMTKLGFYEELT